MKQKRGCVGAGGALSLLLMLSSVALSQTQTPAPTPVKKPDQNQSGQEIDADDVIRITTNMVNSPVLVIGRNGKLVPNLSREDFLLLENGIPQEIAHFATVDKPFTVT